MRPIQAMFLASLVVAGGAHAAATAAKAKQPAPSVDVQTYRVINTLPIGGSGGWDYLSLDAKRRLLFVSRGDHVSVVNVDQGKQVGTINDTQGVHGIALAPALKAGFTSNGQTNSVTMFNLDTLATEAVIPLSGSKPDAIVYDDVSHRVFTMNGKSGNASVIDPVKHTEVATIALPGKPEFAVADGRGHIYVNIEDKSELVDIDTRSHSVKHTWPLPSCDSPSGLALDVIHRRAFSVCDNKTMVVTDISYTANGGKQVAALPIGEGPDAVVFDAKLGVAFSSNGESGTITAVRERDATHFEVAGNIPTTVTARTLALDTQTHRLYLSSARLAEVPKAHEHPKMVPDSFALQVVGQP